MNMLGKDPKRFNKIQAYHDKHEKLAASNKADADADNDSENPTDDDDDDDELEETARDDSTKTVTTKTGTTKKSAPKKTTTTVKQSATTTPASPTLQNGVIAKITKIIKGRKQEDRRRHRSVDYGYWSAPSDSEYEEKRRIATTLSGRTLKLVKLKETIDRHAAWCPFVHLNKKLHHAHRRIRALQHRPNNEPELPKTLDELAKRGHDNDDHDDDHIEKEETNGEDEDDSDSMEEIIIKVPRKRKTQVMAAFEKKSAQVEQLAPPNDDEPERPLAPPPGNEDKSTAPPREKAASKAKATPAKETAHTTKVSTKPVLEESLMDPVHGLSSNGLREYDAEAGSRGGQDSPMDAEDKTNKTDDATGCARNQSFFANEAAKSEDEAPRESSLSSGEEIEEAHNAYLKRQQDLGLAAVTTAEAAKKRKVSETEPKADAEPVSKTRKIRAD
jgi:hypothetical protein